MAMAAADIERMIKERFPDAVVSIDDLAGDGDHYAATVVSEAFASFYDDPDIVWEIMASGALAQTDIGQTVDFAAGTGSATAKRSGFTLNSADIGTGAGLKILELAPKPGNGFGNYAVARVLLNEHELRTGGATAV